MVDNVILGRPTLHKVKVVITPYLLQLQFEADDRSVRVMHGDQQMAQECYLGSIRPLVERANEHGPDKLPRWGKGPELDHHPWPSMPWLSTP